MYTGSDEFKIHDVKVGQLNLFDRNTNAYKVTQVTMWVGDHGPFTQLFGPGQAYPDDAVSIQQWKQQTVNKVRETVAG